MAGFTKYGVLFYIKIRFCNLHFDSTGSCDRCGSWIQFSVFTQWHSIIIIVDHLLYTIFHSFYEHFQLWKSRGSRQPLHLGVIRDHWSTISHLFKDQKKCENFNRLDASFCRGLRRGHDNRVSSAVVKQRHSSMQWMLHLKHLFLPYDNIQMLCLSSVVGKGRLTMEPLQHGRYNLII